MNNKQAILHISRVILVSILTTLVAFAVLYGLQYLQAILRHATVSSIG